VQTRLFIDGEWVDGLDGGSIDVRDPHDGSLLAEVAEARAGDVDRAVRAAQAAFGAWRQTTAEERGRLLLRLADLIEAHADELALLETRDTGHPIRDTRGLDVPRTAATFRYFGGMADKHQGSVVPVEHGFLDYVLREPVGVVGQIVPWNFPLMFTSWKMGPALAAGNTVVLKPSELTPLSTLRVAESMAEAGFPPGVVNIVPGYGATAGQRIAEHPGIGKVSFTGSTAVGRSILAASAGNLKKVQLELGGKGANIVFADADLDAAVQGSAFAIYHNQGQACIAGSRLIVHSDVADEFLDRFVRLSKGVRIGDPKDPATEMGPLTSPGHRDRVLSYLEVAVADGDEIVSGGRVPETFELASGCYLEPTVVATQAGHRIAQQELFGPVVAVQRFHTEDEALRIANGTDYGLGAGLWTRDLSRAHRVRMSCERAWCGSTRTNGSTPAPRSAASGKAGSAARWDSMPCTSTPTPKRCGSTTGHSCLRATPMPDPRVNGFVHDITAPRVVFRTGAAADIVPESDRLDGRRVMLIGAGHQPDLADQVAKELGNRFAGRIGDTVQHVPVAVARAATDAARNLGTDQLLSIGGGSAVGLAKAVARELNLPILAVPTTYAGSEMSPIWGLTGAHGKQTGRDARVLPRTVIYDPALTTSLPARLSATSRMNALAHAMEALYAPDVSPLVVVAAAEAVRAIAGGLAHCVAEPNDRQARADMLYGAIPERPMPGQRSHGHPSQAVPRPRRRVRPSPRRRALGPAAVRGRVQPRRGAAGDATARLRTRRRRSGRTRCFVATRPRRQRTDEPA
jgi:betaine-aldehyde dehydrogenase